MTKSLIHIGYPKTASTWFQNNFIPYISNYKVIEREKVKEAIIEPDAYNFSAAKASSILGIRNERAIFISEEMLIGGIQTGGYQMLAAKEMANRLKTIFKEQAKIIIFIRNQLDIIASLYSHYVRYSGGTYHINKFIQPDKKYILHNRVNLFLKESINYHNIIEYYVSIFGIDNVDIYLYENFRNNRKQFISSFINKYNIEIENDLIDYDFIKRNYSRILLKIIRILNIFTKYNTINKYYLINIPKWHGLVLYVFKKLNNTGIFGRVPTTLEVLGKKNYNLLCNYYKESNKILVDKYDLDIAYHDYPL